MSDKDTIYRQEAIDTMFSEPLYEPGMKKRAADAVVPAIYEKIKSLPSAQPEQRWIPCAERLPYAENGESDSVLATCGHRDDEDTNNRWIRTLYFNGGTWCYPTGEVYMQKVYAWMSLPEPYKV